MEDLTKHQLVLVALLVSFVTSIATGIVTVSLMSQAPASVTQTINRVVEKTVEKIVPANNQATVLTKETLVVNQDKMASDAVEKNTKSLVRIFGIPSSQSNSSDNQTLTEEEKFLGIGIVLNKNGVIVGDKGILSGGTKYFGALYDGTRIPVYVVAADNENDIILFQPGKTDDKKISFDYVPAFLGNSDDLRLGQTIISLYGKERNRVSLGIVSSLLNKPISSDQKKEFVYAIETDLHSEDIALGSFLLNLSGEVVGIKTSTLLGDRDSYLSMNLISEKVPLLLNPAKTE